MLVNKDIITDGVVDKDTDVLKTNQPIFRWPRDSTTVEQIKTKFWSVSPETVLSLGELELYQEEATTQHRKSKSDKKKIGKAKENEESFIHLIQSEEISAISRTI